VDKDGRRSRNHLVFRLEFGLPLSMDGTVVRSGAINGILLGHGHGISKPSTVSDH